jgi:hypothetical protein
MAHCSQGHRRYAAALCAVGVSAKLAWSDFRPKVRRNDFGRSRKDAFFGIIRWRLEFAEEGFGHFEALIFEPQSMEVCDGGSSVRGRKNLRIGCTALRSKDAEPHLCDLWSSCPELQEVIEVALSPSDLRCDGAVNGDSGILDVFEDSFIGSRLAPNIVLWLKTINGNNDIQLLESLPCRRDDPEGAGDDLRVNTALFNLGKEQFELTVTD